MWQELLALFYSLGNTLGQCGGRVSVWVVRDRRQLWHSDSSRLEIQTFEGSKYLSHIHSVPGTVVGIRDTAESQIVRFIYLYMPGCALGTQLATWACLFVCNVKKNDWSQAVVTYAFNPSTLETQAGKSL